jgi:transcriptional antiterminator RfaH
MTTFKVGWYAIYTKPQHEKKVAECLTYCKVMNFLPTIRTLKIWSGKKRYVNLPLFPSYVFVKLESMQQYFDTMQVPGALHFVKTGNQVAGIRESIICKLQAIVSNNIQDIEVSSEYFNPGTVLNINAGPFTGFCCEMIQHKGKNKMLVRIELLQRNIIVDLPCWCLEPVTANELSAT